MLSEIALSERAQYKSRICLSSMGFSFPQGSRNLQKTCFYYNTQQTDSSGHIFYDICEKIYILSARCSCGDAGISRWRTPPLLSQPSPLLLPFPPPGQPAFPLHFLDSQFKLIIVSIYLHYHKYVPPCISDCQGTSWQSPYPAFTGKPPFPFFG